MLVAQTEEGLISLAQRFSLEQLKLWKKEKQFYCPSCQSPVRLKVGTKKNPSFCSPEKHVRRSA
ncbi:competence protein CoiA family protein [Priestia aryabhattai]